MIFQFKEVVLIPLAEIAGFCVLILGIMWLVYGVYEAKRRGSVKERKVEDWDFKITKFLKVLTYLGFVVGVICLLSGVAGLLYDIAPSPIFQSGDPSIFTSALLIILGILTFLKPMNDLPIASVIGLLVASAVVAIIVMAIPTEIVDVLGLYLNTQLFFAIVFIIIFAIAALTAKFYIGTLMKISKGISWPPIAFILAAFCFLQGFLVVVVGISIGYLF